MQDFITPDRRVVAALKREASRRIRKDAGEHFDIRWDERGCLCVMEKNLRGAWSVRREIWGDDGNPRQADMRDVEEVIKNRYGWCEQVDNWKRSFFERKAQAEAKKKERRHERNVHTAKELVRVAREGFRTYVFQPPERPEKTEQINEVTVVDRRRNFEEATA